MKHASLHVPWVKHMFFVIFHFTCVTVLHTKKIMNTFVSNYYKSKKSPRLNGYPTNVNLTKKESLYDTDLRCMFVNEKNEGV
jgi:hypothetical protein